MAVWQVSHVAVFFKTTDHVNISFVQLPDLEKTSSLTSVSLVRSSGLGLLSHFLSLRHKQIRCPINSNDCLAHLPREGGNVASTVKFIVPCVLY